MKYDWPRILSNLAIILGLVLVWYELNQNQELSRAQAQMDDSAALQAFEHTLMGDNPAAAIVKARADPTQLSAEEKIIVDSYVTSIFVRLESYEYVSVFVDWESAVTYDLRKSLNFEYARNWWEREKEYGADWRPRITEMVDDFYSQNPLN